MKKERGREGVCGERYVGRECMGRKREGQGV